MNTVSTENSIDYIISTLAIEGLAPSQDAIDLCRKLSEGALTPSEAEKAVFEKYGFYGVTSNA